MFPMSVLSVMYLSSLILSIVFIKIYIINTSKGHVLFHVTSEGLQNELAMFT